MAEGLAALVACVRSRRDASVIYSIRFAGDRYTCDCPGFFFRKTCRHVTILAALGAVAVSVESTPIEVTPPDRSARPA